MCAPRDRHGSGLLTPGGAIVSDLKARSRAAWQGRVSGCQLGKPVEAVSILQGHEAGTAYLVEAGALPLRDYVPVVEGTMVAQLGRTSCRG